jgi:hypothetical protein
MALATLGVAVLAYALILLRRSPAQRGPAATQAEPAGQMEPTAGVLIAQP